MSPRDFISLAEDTRLIAPVGDWVLQEACRRARAWQETLFPSLKIAVNLSAGQLNRDLFRTVERVLQETNLDPESLDLEITETMAMHNVTLSMDLLSALRRLGVQVSMDDFGTGHSSLSYLKCLPITAVKIDQSFVRDITTDPGDEAIVSAVIGMAHSMKLRVIAEGVETQEQVAYLQQHGVEDAQGYWFSEPLPAEMLDDVLRNHRIGKAMK